MNSRPSPILVALAVIFLVFPALGGVLYAMLAVIHYLDLPLWEQSWINAGIFEPQLDDEGQPTGRVQFTRHLSAGEPRPASAISRAAFQETAP